MRDEPETMAFYWKRLPHWEVARGRYFVTIRLQGAIPEQGMSRVRELNAQVERAIANGQDGWRERQAVFEAIEHWLDRADPVAHLRTPQVAEMVIEAITHRERAGVWTVFSYVIMPNHLHLFVRLGSSDAAVPSRPRPPAAASPDPMPLGSRLAVATYCGPLPPAAASGAGQRTVPAGMEPGPGRHAESQLEGVLADFKKWTGRQGVHLLGLSRGTRFWQREWFDHWSRSLEEDEGTERYIRQNPVKAGLVRFWQDWPWAR